jgi:hypothetical protein
MASGTHISGVNRLGRESSDIGRELSDQVYGFTICAYFRCALREAVPVLVVSEQLGCASVAFTLDVYGHVLEATRAAASDRLSQVLLSAAKPRRPIERGTAKRKSA